MLEKAKRVLRALFGDRFNLFFDVGLWHAGRFLDNEPPIKSVGSDRVAPWRRPQEVFGVGESLEEAIRFATGGKIYSVAGMEPGIGGARGFRVVYDKHGRVRGYESAAGIFSRRFPGEPGSWS